MEADVKRKTVETALAELDAKETLFMDGLDNAIIGIGQQYGGPTLVIYDEQQIVQELVDGQEMDIEEAIEYYYVNIKHAYYGAGTPIIVESLQALEQWWQ